MALPTMRPHWVKTFKTPAELSKINVERRDYNLEKNKANNRFFVNNEVTANKAKAWTSQTSLKKSMSSIDKLFDDANKIEKLDELNKRRQKLRELIERENKEFQEELKQKRLYLGNKDISTMRQRVDDLQAEKEEKRKLLAEEKLYEHWRKNEPRLRQIESEKVKKTVVNKWGEQLTERNEVQKTARDAESKLNHYMELEQLKAMEKEKKREEERMKKQKQISKDLRDQMAALQERERETEILKEEEERLNEHQSLLQDAEIKRKQYLEDKKKQELGRVLIRQYKLQLKRKSKQVQEALEIDLKILNEIASKEKEERMIESSRKEKLKADADYMQKVIGDQLRLEKSREAELDLLYQEEASRQWRKRESEWERERIARERLMQAVLEERQEQINEKMERVHEQQKVSIEERERLLEQLEEHEVLTHREQVYGENKKKQREEELKQQITSRETEREKSHRKEQELLQQKRLDEDHYEDVIQREANRINQHQNSSFPSFRRKKVAFT